MVPAHVVNVRITNVVKNSGETRQQVTNVLVREKRRVDLTEVNEFKDSKNSVKNITNVFGGNDSKLQNETNAETESSFNAASQVRFVSLLLAS